MADFEDEDARPIVMDNGSGITKAGFAGDDKPLSVFKSIVGRRKQQFPMHVGMGGPSPLVGSEAIEKEISWNLDNKHIIKQGIIDDWDDIERIWYHTFYNELRVAPEEHPVLLTHSPNASKLDREKMTQIIFETFNVPSFYLANQPMLTLYSYGKTEGVVVSSGYDVTYISPIYEGYILPHLVQKLDIGGNTVSQYLIKVFNEKGYTNLKTDIIKNIKKTHCFITMDYAKEIENDDIKQMYQLPDGKLINIGTEQFECTELLFNPQLIGMEQNGIHKLIIESIEGCDDDIKKEMYENIVLDGGNTMFKGFDKRLQQEIHDIIDNQILIDGYLRKYCHKKLYNDIIELMNKYTSYQSKVHSSKNNQYSVWIGGSLLAQISAFQQCWILKQEYDESGPSIVHRKCF